MKILALVLFMSGCAYGVESHSPHADASQCITAKDATGAPAYHPCDPSDPWVDASSGLECTQSPVQVGDACYYRGQPGVAEN